MSNKDSIFFPVADCLIAMQQGKLTHFDLFRLLRPKAKKIADKKQLGRGEKEETESHTCPTGKVL